MINYDKVKTLIDRFDPEAQAAAAQAAAVAAMQQGGCTTGAMQVLSPTVEPASGEAAHLLLSAAANTSQLQAPVRGLLLPRCLCC